MSRLQYAVVIDDSHVSATAEIAGKLSEQGFSVESVAPEIGAIYGSAEEALIPKLRAVQGVEEVRPEESVQLPPFSSSTPQ